MGETNKTCISASGSGKSRTVRSTEKYSTFQVTLEGYVGTDEVGADVSMEVVTDGNVSSDVVLQADSRMRTLQQSVYVSYPSR